MAGAPLERRAHRAAQAAAGAAGPGAERSEFRSGKPEEAQGAQAPRGGQGAQRVQLDPRVEDRDEELPSMQWDPRGGAPPSRASLRFLPATKPPAPGRRAQELWARPPRRPAVSPPLAQYSSWGFWGEKKRAGGGGWEETQKYHLCQFFLKSNFFSI